MHVAKDHFVRHLNRIAALTGQQGWDVQTDYEAIAKHMDADSRSKFVDVYPAAVKALASKIEELSDEGMVKFKGAVPTKQITFSINDSLQRSWGLALANHTVVIQHKSGSFSSPEGSISRVDLEGILQAIPAAAVPVATVKPSASPAPSAAPALTLTPKSTLTHAPTTSTPVSASTQAPASSLSLKMQKIKKISNCEGLQGDSKLIDIIQNYMKGSFLPHLKKIQALMPGAEVLIDWQSFLNHSREAKDAAGLTMDQYLIPRMDEAIVTVIDRLQSIPMAAVDIEEGKNMKTCVARKNFFGFVFMYVTKPTDMFFSGDNFANILVDDNFYLSYSGMDYILAQHIPYKRTNPIAAPFEKKNRLTSDDSYYYDSSSSSSDPVAAASGTSTAAPKKCSFCHGKGVHPDGVTKCNTCKGKGYK